jgi:hypothetical protein
LPEYDKYKAYPMDWPEDKKQILNAINLDTTDPAFFQDLMSQP